MRAAIKRQRAAIRLFILDLMITLLVWGGFYRESFGTDTLFRRMLPMSDIGGALDQQRYASYFLAKFLYDHGILVTDHYRFFFLFFLLTIAADIWLIERMFYPKFREAAGGDLLCLAGYIASAALIYGNVLFSENFMFPEYHVNYAFAYLLGTLAFCAFARKRLVWGALSVAGACLFYQVAIVYTAILITAWLVIEYDFKPDRELIGRELLVNVMIAAVGTVDYLSNGWLKATGLLERSAGGKIIRPAFGETVLYLKEETVLLMKNSLCLMPSLWAPLAVSAIGMVLLAIALIKGRKDRWISFFLFLLVETGWFYLLPMLAGPGSLTPRVAFPFYAVQAMCAMAAMLTVKRAVWRRLLSVVMAAYLLLQGFFDQVIIGNRYLSNRLDVLYAESVLREIAKQEERTGIPIRRVAIENDAYAPNSYDEVKFKRDQVNERVLAVSPFTLLEYVNGPGVALEHVEMDPEIWETYFAGKDWDYFDPEEQLVFIGDTLYWAVF